MNETESFNIDEHFFFFMADDILRVGSQIILGKSSKEPIMAEWKAEVELCQRKEQERSLPSELSTRTVGSASSFCSHVSVSKIFVWIIQHSTFCSKTATKAGP